MVARVNVVGVVRCVVMLLLLLLLLKVRGLEVCDGGIVPGIMIWMQSMVVVVQDFVGCVFSSASGDAGAATATAGAVVTGFFFFVEFVVRVGREGVFCLVVFVGDGERVRDVVRGGGAREGAVAAVVEEVFDGDEACGYKEETVGMQV